MDRTPSWQRLREWNAEIDARVSAARAELAALECEHGENETCPTCMFAHAAIYNATLDGELVDFYYNARLSADDAARLRAAAEEIGHLETRRWI